MSKIKVIDSSWNPKPSNKTNSLEDFIILIKEAMRPDVCDEILEYYSQTDEWTQSRVGDGTVAKDIRNVDEIPISAESIVNKDKERRSEIDNLVFQVAGKCIQTYHTLFPWCGIEIDTGYNLLKYSKDNFYKEHVDSFTRQQRSVSCSIGLNNNFKGGKFSFFDNSLSIKVEKGDALLFPSSFQYPHQITPVKQGTRYSIVTWFV